MLAAIGYVLALLATVTLLTASGSWSSKLPLLGVLLLSWRSLARLPGTVGQLSLWDDGLAWLDAEDGKQEGTQTGQAWVTSLFCVVTVRLNESGQFRHCVVCAAQNHSDDFRRLRAWCRIGMAGMPRKGEWAS